MRVASSTAQLGFVFPSEGPEPTGFVQANSLPQDRVYRASLKDISVSATPTLFLVDRTGFVQRVWIGKLSEKEEKEVEQALTH